MNYLCFKVTTCPSATVLKLIACQNSIISVPSPWLRAHFHEKLTNMSSHHKGSVCYSHPLHKGHKWQSDGYYGEDETSPSTHQLAVVSDGENERDWWNFKNLLCWKNEGLRCGYWWTPSPLFPAAFSRTEKHRTVLRTERKVCCMRSLCLPSASDEHCWLECADMLKRR